MSYDVHVHRQEISALFDLKGDQAALEEWAGERLPPFPRSHNQFTAANGKFLLHIGRRHWILRTAIEREEECLADLKPAEAPPPISIVRISDTLTFFAVTGPDAAEVMSVACPLDLHPAACGDRDVTFTEVFGLKALVRRVVNGFEFAVEQSFGDMVSDYLKRATA